MSVVAGLRMVDFAEHELGVRPTPKQAEALGLMDSAEQLILRWGRRAGKSLCADVITIADAVLRDHLREHMRPGEPRVSAIICPRLDQAQSHIANIGRMLRSSPRLARMVVSETSDEITLSNGSQIKAFPCSARSIRGGAWSCLVLDEMGHFLTGEDGNAAGDRVLEAAQPSLAQFGHEARLVAISTPLWKSGAFFKLCERAESGRFPYMVALHATTAEANPNIAPDWLEDRRREDPDMFGREFEARWVDGASSYLNSVDVIACRRPEGILAPRSGVTYEASLDPAFANDRFSMGVAHQEDGVAVIDGVWVWRRQGYENTLDEVQGIANAYSVRTLKTDQFCEAPVREGLAKRGLSADYQPWSNESKSDAFSALKIGLNTRRVSLPDDSGLVEELCALEARPTPGGKVRIAAAGSAHDDRAVVVASLVHGLTAPSAIWINFMVLDDEDDRAAPVTSNDPFDQLPF